MSYTLQLSATYPVALEITSPGPSWVSIRNATPYTFSLSAIDDKPYTISLYAQNSRSSPIVSDNKWGRLIPQWWFEDTDGVKINSITPTQSTLQLNVSGETVGIVLTGEFYYVDDRQTIGCQPTIIWAVVDFSENSTILDVNNATVTNAGYSNSKIAAAVYHFTNGVTPSRMSITRNGDDDLFPYYWKNANISHIIGVGGAIAPLTAFYNFDPSLLNILHDYPETNIYGVSGGVVFRNTVPTIAGITWTPTSNTYYLSAEDSASLSVNGYLQSRANIPETGTGIVLSASATIVHDKAWVHTPYLWISNPENNTLNRFYTPCVDSSINATVTAFMEAEKISTPDVQTVFDITSLQVTSAATIMSLTGFGGIYGLAIDPTYNVWATDAESDKIYKFSTTGDLLSSIDCLPGSTPAGVSIDGLGYIWVSFFDSASCIKIHNHSGAIVTTIDPASIITPYSDYTYKPTIAEPDMNNNVYVSYTNQISSSLYKFDNTGIYLGMVALPSGSTPMDICIDRDNHVWVSLAYHSGDVFNTGYINKYHNTTYTLLSSVTATHPEYLSLDSENSIWFTQNFNTVSRYKVDGSLTHYIVGSSTAPVWATAVQLNYNALEGLAVDSYDRVWCIESIENKLYKISTSLSAAAVFANITPDTVNVSLYNDSGVQTSESNAYAKSAQAFGDWTGMRWMRKYIPGSVLPTGSTVLTATLSGVSSPFDVITDDDINLRRYNESWKAGNQLPTYAKTPHIRNNTILWDEYMNGVWGTEDSVEGKAFGRQLFDKIANFSKDHSDPNVCGVDQLYSLAEQTDVPLDDYNIALPGPMKRIMNLVSINQQRLWGTRCVCNQNITNAYSTSLSGTSTVYNESYCNKCGHYHVGNRGDVFSGATYMVSAGVPFIVKDRYDDKTYTLITPPLSSSVNYLDAFEPCVTSNNAVTSISVYPLSAAYTWLLPTLNTPYTTPTYSDFLTVIQQFCFYGYYDIKCGKQVSGEINWDDPNTTLTENVSSLEEWYGDNGTIEKMFSKVLHMGLGFINE